MVFIYWVTRITSRARSAIMTDACFNGRFVFITQPFLSSESGVAVVDRTVIGQWCAWPVDSTSALRGVHIIGPFVFESTLHRSYILRTSPRAALSLSSHRHPTSTLPAVRTSVVISRHLLCSFLLQKSALSRPRIDGMFFVDVHRSGS